MQANAAAQTEGFGPGQVFARCQPVLAKIVAENGDSIDGMKMDVLSIGVKAIVLKFSGPDWAYVVKAFNPVNPDAKTLLDREYKILDALNDWPLKPKLVAGVDDTLLLITEAVEGETLDKILTEENVLGVAHHVAAWYSIFSKGLPKIPQQEGDWASYLARYDDLFTADELEHNHAMLSALKINNLGMSKNDAVLANFIRDVNGNLVGLDFAAAAMKPVGWDLLLTGRILAQSFPEKVPAIAQAMVRGWRDKIDGNLPDDFAQLIAFFAEVTALRTPAFVHGPAQKYRQNYAASAKADPSLPEAAHVFRFYTFDNDLEPVSAENKQALRAALLEQAREAVATPLEEGEAEKVVETNDPGPVLTAACTLCVGGCCRRGQASFAYLKAPTLRRMLRQNPQITAEEIADFYIARVPDTHVKGSCLYHGETGCALPRDLRSNICNRYVCRFGRIIENSQDRMRDKPGPVLLVGTDDGRAKVAQVMDGERVIPIDPALVEHGPQQA